MKKRSIALLLALVLTLSVLPAPARAAARETKLAAVTFDDGPGRYTDGLLDELNKRGVTATFFMQGHNASRYPAVIQKAYETGHQIASHTYSHPQLTRLSTGAIQQELTAAANVLNRAIGRTHSYLVRPPYGSVNSRVLSALNVPAILWSVDTRDWESRNPDAIYRHMVHDTRDGAIILLHDVHATTIPGALRGIDALLDQGYELVTVSELLRRRGIAAAPGKRYASASGRTTLPGVSPPVMTAAETAEGLSVTLSADAGTTVYYTTDGSAPTSRSRVYTGPLTLAGGETVRAFAAWDLNGGRSRESSQTLPLPRAKSPAIALENGLARLSASGEIHYTLDGSTPTANSPRYSEPVPLPPGTMIQAIALRPGCRDSTVSRLCHSELSNLFTDLSPAQWYYPAVDQVVSRGLMTTRESRFFPDRAATRREVVTVLHRLAGSPAPEVRRRFPDLPEDDPACSAAAWAVERGILTGFSDGTIRPDDSVTRQQLAVFLFRMGQELPEIDSPPPQSRAFSDWESVSGYAREAMDWAVSCGLLHGTAQQALDPGGTLTRAQLAAILLRLQPLSEAEAH